MNSGQHAIQKKQRMSYAELRFERERIQLIERHHKELKEAQFKAKQTHNRGAMLPAEAACYISHAKALVVVRAKCFAEAYTSFLEPMDQDADSAISRFFAEVVAAGKSNFQAQADLRAKRTREIVSHTQLNGLPRGFEIEASSALSESRAILEKRRIELDNRPQHSPILTKYVEDTSVLNWLTDSWIERDSLPSDGGFAITHVQVDEINATKDENRRAGLLLTQASLRPELLPAHTVVLGISRLGHAKLGDGLLLAFIRTELDALKAIANGYVLLTADEDLSSATQKHGGKVMFFAR